MLFQLRSHAYLYEGTPQHVIDEQTQPGILQRMNSTSSESSSSTSTRSNSVSTASTGGSTSRRRAVKRKIKAKLGRKRSTKTEEEIIQEEQEISPDGPAPLPSEDVSKKPARDEKIGAEMSGGVGGATAKVEVNTSTATEPTAKRPSPVTRGFTIRPPPVFRTDSNTNQQQNLIRYRHVPYELRRFNSAPIMPASNMSPATDRPFRAGTGLSQRAETQPIVPVKSTDEEPALGLTPAIILLLGSTALVAVCAEFMVSSIEHLVENSPLSEAFIGLIILPIVGNAAEHVTAVVVASKNKLDLALGVSLGSSIQIALFITPLVVIIGWILDKGMSLYFTLFETVCLFVSVFVVCFLCLDGKSNYLEGALLCAAYIIIGVGAYFFPDSEGQNILTGGTNEGG